MAMIEKMGQYNGEDIFAEEVRQDFWIAYIIAEGYCGAGKTALDAKNEFVVLANSLANNA